MKKLALALLLSLLLLLVIVLAVLLYTSAGPRLILYGLDSVEGVSVERIDGKLAGELDVTNFSFTSDLVDLSVGHSRFSWQPGRLFESTLQIGELLVQDVVIRFKEVDTAEEKKDSEPFSLPELSLPLAVLIEHFRVENIWFQEKGTDSWMIRELDLEAEYDRKNYIVHHFHFDAPQAVFDLQGRVATAGDWPVAVQGNWKLTFEGYSAMEGDIEASGPLTRLDVAASAAAPFTLSVKGVLEDLLSEPTWTAKLDNGYGNLKNVNKGWPDIELEHVAGDAKGDFGTYGGRVSGTASYWRAEGVSLVIDLLGHADGIRFDNIDGYLDGAHAKVSGEIGWMDHFFWKGTGDVVGLNPAEFVDHFDGAVDGRLTSEGEIGYQDTDILHCYFDSDRLSGTLHGYPVRGQARVRVDGTDVGFDNIEIYSEDSLLKLDGTLTDDFDLDFSIHSPDIGHFVDSGSGALDGEGTLDGPLMNPLLVFTLAGQDIQYEQTRIAGLDGKGRIDLSPAGEIDAAVQASGIKTGALVIDRAEVRSKGDVNDHCINLSMQSVEGDGEAQFCGKYADSSWVGDISQFTFSSKKYGDWLLARPSAITVGAEKSELDQLCMKNSDGGLCLDFSLDEGAWSSSLAVRDFDLHYFQKLVSIPYAYQGKAELDIRAAGRMGTLDTSDLSLKINNAAVTIPLAGDHTKLVRWDANAITAKLDDDLIEVKINSRFSDGSFIIGTLAGKGSATADQGSLFENDITGKVEVELAEMEDLGFLTQYIVRPKGKLHGDFELAGTLADPWLDGEVQIDTGEFAVPSIGTTFKHSTLALEADREGVWVKATTHAGEGLAKGEGYLLYEKGTEMFGRFSVKGENLDLVDLPEYEITANTDVQFLFNEETGRISGNIEFPKARIAPVHMATAVSESKDVVYVDGGEEEQNVSWPLKTELSIKFGDNVVVSSFGLHGRVEGAIQVNGEPGEDLTALGELAVKDATFSIYRRVLDIERGRVQFSGGPIENPSLDIRAQRSVEDNIAGRNGGWTVGVDVSGNVDDLDFALFSSPSMSDSDILAYLIVGHSAESSNSEEDGLLKTAATALGVGGTATLMEEFSSIIPVDDVHMEGGSSTEDASIVVGKRLTDDLYVGYDYNFYQSTSEFILRYNLGRGFYIETQSSSEANGADIFYSFEN